MAKANMPWSLKGVSPEARRAAKVAAQRAGVPLGVWLSRVIRDVAAGRGTLRGNGDAAAGTTRSTAPRHNG